MGDEYRRFRTASSTAMDREWLLAEAFEAGAEGAEEQDEPMAGGAGTVHRAWIYVQADAIESVRAQLGEIVRTASMAGAEIGPAEPLAPIDWSEEWKRGLGPIEVSPRLLIRPPFARATLRPGQHEIVIDPGQAFGTGTHASTHLCLEWIDALLAEAPAGAPETRVLDVGTGSGILALAAVALGAGSALGFDLDPVAIEAANEAAAHNGLAERVRFECVAIDALPETPGYELIVANLLKREMLPIAGEIARQLAPAGSLVLAGLLEEDAEEVAERFAEFGLVEQARRVRVDPVGRWIAPRYGRSAVGAASRTSQSS
ncbi:MAG: 50S ribosomal protein L11 methyltransferase [Myxococcota bacterium]